MGAGSAASPDMQGFRCVVGSLIVGAAAVAPARSEPGSPTLVLVTRTRVTDSRFSRLHGESGGPTSITGTARFVPATFYIASLPFQDALQIGGYRALNVPTCGYRAWQWASGLRRRGDGDRPGRAVGTR